MMRSVLGRHHLLFFPLSGVQIERHEKARKQEGFLATRLAAAAKPMVVILQGDGDTVLVRSGTWLHPLSSSECDHAARLLDATTAVYVGEDTAQRNVFATCEDNITPEFIQLCKPMHSRVLLADMNAGTEAECGLLGLSIEMLRWTRRCRYCPTCGGFTVPTQLGLTRKCEACACTQYPQVNPAMIVAVLDGRGNVILGERAQQRNYLRDEPKGGEAPSKPKPKPWRTILAGYVSHGESMEEAVCREVMEESAARVTSVRYVGSQPWPWPHQLMGCYYALADSSLELHAEEDEMASVAWTSKEDVRRALAGEHPDFVVPPAFTAAHVLLREWVEGRIADDGSPVC